MFWVMGVLACFYIQWYICETPFVCPLYSCEFMDCKIFIKKY